jgi:transposase-like protein
MSAPSKDGRAIMRHGFYRTRWGKRRRYQCQTCRKTFSSTTGTPYRCLQHRRATFEEVAALSVEGLNKSAIARVKRIAWNTVHRWLERAAAWCRRFNNRKTKGLSLPELQADEIRTIIGGREESIWVFVVIDVWSRLWPSTVVGKRSYRHTLDLFRDLSHRMNLEVAPLISTDGFKFASESSDECLGQPVSRVRSSRRAGTIGVVRVERRDGIGAGATATSSAGVGGFILNASFVERLNLRIRTVYPIWVAE